MNGRISQDIVSDQKSSKKDPHHRGNSWEHCYSYFKSNEARSNPDHACLHLGFYLASWGMYRGSGKLLQKDYLVHREAVDFVTHPKYEELRDLTFADCSNSNKINDLFCLRENLEKSYIRQGVVPTETLITKILMGTLGCVPAYDRYFNEGLKKADFKFRSFTEKDFPKLINELNKNSDDFEKLKNQISELGIPYPIMKIVDRYFFEVGRQSEEEKRMRKGVIS